MGSVATTLLLLTRVALAAQAAAVGLSPEDGSFTTTAGAFETDEDDHELDISSDEELVAA